MGKSYEHITVRVGGMSRQALNPPTPCGSKRVDAGLLALSLLVVLDTNNPSPTLPGGLGSAGFQPGLGSVALLGTIDFAATVCQKSILEPPGSLWELIFNLREIPGAYIQPPGASGSCSNSFSNKK